MKDRQYAEELNAQADAMLAKYSSLAQEIYLQVTNQCR